MSTYTIPNILTSALGSSIHKTSFNVGWDKLGT